MKYLRTASKRVAVESIRMNAYAFQPTWLAKRSSELYAFVGLFVNHSVWSRGNDLHIIQYLCHTTRVCTVDVYGWAPLKCSVPTTCRKYGEKGPFPFSSGSLCIYGWLLCVCMYPMLILTQYTQFLKSVRALAVPFAVQPEENASDTERDRAHRLQEWWAIMRIREIYIFANGKTIRSGSMLVCEWMSEWWVWPSEFAYIFCTIPFSAIWLHYNINSFNFLLNAGAPTAYVCVPWLWELLQLAVYITAGTALCAISIQHFIIMYNVREWL